VVRTAKIPAGKAKALLLFSKQGFMLESGCLAEIGVS
jgi:hypothetical protein